MGDVCACSALLCVFEFLFWRFLASVLKCKFDLHAGACKAR
jgi:hypothetical protein